MTQHFYSNGKLLLTGEYAVLDGTLSLALPTTYGQSLNVIPIKQSKIIWQAYDHNDQIWFETEFDLPLSQNDHGSTIRTKLHTLLKKAQSLNPNFLEKGTGFNVKTEMNFVRNWGLGSSSTLINNIAQWAKVDAYALLKSISKGSGYDIACAQNDLPITYSIIDQKRTVTPTHFLPIFHDQIFFVHLNKKQDSAQGIKYYREKEASQDFIDDITQITKEVLTCPSLNDFETLIAEHENIIAGVLKTLPIKRRIFSDYFGVIKSLGAWGGDFILVTGNEDTPSYFKSRGFETVIPYHKMIKGFDNVE